jgi:two-component system OmpR family sensor kinase
MKTLEYEAEHLKQKLRELHQSNAKILHYPKSKIAKSAIYDLDKNYIFGTFKQSLDARDKDKLYFQTKVEPYYLGTAYLLLQKDIDEKPIKDLQKNIIIFMIAVGVFFSILGYFLGRLFIAPMREAIEKMNRFIQDATHELNTPISTILTNIEMIETFGNCDSKQELRRIEIASKTLSKIYDDLSYLNLNHNYHTEVEKLNFSELLKERITYFSSVAGSKKIAITSDIEKDLLIMIDRNDATRLIDNLISNAIKYNKQNGTIDIILTKDNFIVKDSGIGMKEEDMKTILTRFKRANDNEGGFGIGLDIVNYIVKRYNFTLSIESKKDIGTKVSIKW